jgi:hypothetical protein
MTSEQFRKMALRLPGSSERSHMGHPDFRVQGKIFATLGYPEKGWAMVKLRPNQQREFVQADPESFVEVKGAWGRRGSTNVRLRVTTAKTLKPALDAAWRNVAPKALPKG